MGIETLLEGLDLLSVKRKSERRTEDSLFNCVREDEYQVAFIDKGFKGKMPFVVNKEIIELAKDVSSNSENNYEKAAKIHGWVTANIAYGTKKRKCNYRNSLETFFDREGVCGEMSMLYITMARSVGIRASYAFVDVDHENKKVNHACSIIDIQGKYGKNILADAAYQKFDVKHITYRPLTDFETFQGLNSF